MTPGLPNKSPLPRGGERVRVRGGLALLLLTAGLVVPGCGFHLVGHGAGLPPQIQVLAIPTIQNQTERIEVEQRLTEALVQEFIKRGKVKVVSLRSGADAVLEGTLTEYRVRPVGFTAEQRVNRAEVTIQTSLVLRDLSEDAVLWQNPQFVFRQQYEVPEDAIVLDSGGQVVEEYFDQEILAIEEISREFARSVVATLFEGF